VTLESPPMAPGSMATIDMVRDFILAGHEARHVVLIEIDPWAQKTSMDFRATAKMFGVPTVAVDEVSKKGNKLYYTDASGEEVEIRRLYNRVIPDDFERMGLAKKTNFSFSDDLDVEWAEHPAWSFMVSKASIPHIDHPCVPK